MNTIFHTVGFEEVVFKYLPASCFDLPGAGHVVDVAVSRDAKFAFGPGESGRGGDGTTHCESGTGDKECMH